MDDRRDMQARGDGGAGRTIRRGLAVLAAALLASLAARATYAQPTITGEVMVILGTEAAGPTSPELASIAALRAPPFSTTFGALRLLASHPLELSPGTPRELTLPNGRVVRVIVEAATPGGRFPTRVTINTPGTSDYLPLLSVVAAPCVPNFIAGQPFDGGTLIIGVRIGESCR